MKQTSKMSKIWLKNTIFWVVSWSLFNFDWKVEDETLKFEFFMKFCFDRHPSWPLRTETSGDISCFILCFEILTTAAPSIIFFHCQNDAWSINLLFDGNISGISTDDWSETKLFCNCLYQKWHRYEMPW